jgi:hypothetical protein
LEGARAVDDDECGGGSRSCAFVGGRVHPPLSSPLPSLHQFIAAEDRFGAHNYSPLPVVLKRGVRERERERDEKVFD